MEHAQRVVGKSDNSLILYVVLILILMEHAQRADRQREDYYATGLNPYFNGTCSKSGIRVSVRTLAYIVLILILMEHAQRDL